MLSEQFETTGHLCSPESYEATGMTDGEIRREVQVAASDRAYAQTADHDRALRMIQVLGTQLLRLRQKHRELTSPAHLTS